MEKFPRNTHYKYASYIKYPKKCFDSQNEKRCRRKCAFVFRIIKHTT